MERVDASWSVYSAGLLFEKKSDEYPVAFRRFAKKEGKRANIAKDVKTWLAYVNSEVFLR